MFPFFNKYKGLINTFPLNVDIHAHLIPGIDDGPTTIEESISMIEKLAKIGYEKLTATPHVFSEFYPNSSHKILTHFERLEKAVVEAKIPITLEVAAEYFLDAHFLDLLYSEDLLMLNNNQLLVEMSTCGSSLNSKDILSQIIKKGYQPILAHPERYLYLKEEDYMELLHLGCSFQMNMLSVVGYYGKDVKRRALKLIENNQVHHFGTDAHSEAQVDLITEIVNQKPLISSAYRFLMPLTRASIF